SSVTGIFGFFIPCRKMADFLNTVLSGIHNSDKISQFCKELIPIPEGIVKDLPKQSASRLKQRIT
ncbi:MAG: hypothetical protein LWW85_15675, partial [Marinilabiliales bacterium]|nr:hypothetical protein [Marinilabiliales bacterium]